MKRLVAAFAAALLVAGVVSVSLADDGESAENWARWRGEAGMGVSSAKALPAEWSASKNVQWKTPIEGRGLSSPIIWGNRVFLTTAVTGEPAPEGHKAPVHMINGQPWKHPDAIGADRVHTLKVVALDRASGKILWERTAYQGPIYDDYHKRNTNASATPVTDGKKLFAFFGSEGLYAYDFSGKLAWKADIAPISTMSVGGGGSPILYENLLIVQCDRGDGKGSDIVAYDKDNGKVVWRTSREGIQLSWTTPIVVDAPGGPQLITSANEFTIAYNPRTGKELWRTEGVKSNAIPSPLAGHGMIYVFTGYPRKKVMGLRLVADSAPEVVWTYDRGTAYVASPILYGDYLYLMSDKGILTCLDAKTGEVKYADGRVPVSASF
ncbi:MAG TPA: PQQ-binding-like beta-propeller repeat protein, partial [Candidatus Acidoferrales bacterium]